MKKIKLLSTFMLLFLINSINIFSQQELEKLIPIDGGDGGNNNCTLTIQYNSQPVPISAIPLSKSVHSLNFNVTRQYCYKTLKVISTEGWVGLPSNTFFNGGVLSITIPANNTPITRYARISIVEDNGDGLYSLLLGGNIRIEQQGDSSLNTYYIDTDGDSYGDETAEPIYAHNVPLPIIGSNGQSISFVTNNLDKCPKEASSINNGCEDDLADKNRNWVKSKNYDIKGRLLGANKSYYDDLGKLHQSQIYDIKSKQTWASHIFYDSKGRTALQTLSAPTSPEGASVSFGYKENFVKNKTGNLLTIDDIESRDVKNSVEISPNGNSLGSHYSNRESFQDETNRPYSKSIYSKLNPGKVKQVVGGNKHDTNGNGVIDENNDEWKQSYSFSMSAAQEMYYVYGYTTFPSTPSEANNYTNISSILNNNNNHITWLKAGKSVLQDKEGNESIIFTDAEGKTLAGARSGGTQKYEVVSLIGKQKFVDIHIPIGCDNTASLLGNSADYKIYNLKTEQANGDISKAGFYRVEYVGDRVLTKSHILSYINKSSKTIHSVKSDAVGIRYKVNYYDYSLNYYNDAGQLTSSLQPLGFDDSCLNELKAVVSHNNSLKSTYVYNSLGQLIRTKSPDEGEVHFKYRKDGQIRFSQNSKQKANGEFSYTNYDEFVRPVESGVAVGSFNINLNPDILVFTSSSKKEQKFIEYDFLTVTSLNHLKEITGTREEYQKPVFLSGKIARTYNKDSNGIIISETYYSYDVYGRVKWVVQKSIGFNDAKTIDYEYDPINNQVTKVYFEKGNMMEQFIHKYSYKNDTKVVEKVETSTDDNIFTTHATYDYYKDGSLKRKVLAGGIQDIDYIYTLNGMLKGINHPDLATDSELNPKGNDLFGLKLDYYVGDYKKDTRFSTNNLTGFKDQYNGNIKAMTWNTKSTKSDISRPLQYKYNYNKNDWLKEAIFDGLENQQNTLPADLVLEDKITSTQNKEATSSIVLKPGFEVIASNSLTFSAKIINVNSNGVYGPNDYNVSNITYDVNGNIKSLDRNKNTVSGADNSMDKLKYEYKEGTSNKLDHIIDNAGSVGVQDIDTQRIKNYKYNSIGQLIEDFENVSLQEQLNYELNGTQVPTGLVRYYYNVRGLVTEVKKGIHPVVKFIYNDKGYRIQKLSYNQYGNLTKTTNYVLDASGSTMAIYEGQEQKELPVYGLQRLGVYNKTTNVNVYQLTDHLGNVRAAIIKSGDKAIAVSKTDYYPYGMPMPNRNIEGGYRYKYQGQEKDIETGKEAFQLRLWDARIGRWLTIDPKGQYFSPYMAMDNKPNQSTDPTGGCTDCSKCPDACSNLGMSSIKKGTSIDYNFDTNKFFVRNNLDSSLLNLVSVMGNSGNLAGLHPTIDRMAFKQMQTAVRGAGHDFFNHEVTQAVMVLIAAPFAWELALVSGPALGLSTEGFAGRMTYDFTTELVANDFNIKKVNFLGVGISALTAGNGNKVLKALEVFGAGVDLTIQDGWVLKNAEQTMVSFYAGRLSTSLMSTKSPVSLLGSSLLGGFVKITEDNVNEHVFGHSWIFGNIAKGVIHEAR
ncbi:RHS repeat-associated core domain-containing protein [uncultured Tenacibaculum sp.]|uniref:RHS repeat domain-containing protein n=1 Tax=uncultured Tenacibaculum sp. TaxID=174713 RepID=UPI0026203B56|nr:RHS repeat-associated core domain-containing protein [uncultured Tenacibaculum sp.]